METVREKDVYASLEKLKTVLEWVIVKHIDPLAFRQALLIVLECNRANAILTGISREEIAQFDKLAIEDVQTWITRMK